MTFSTFQIYVRAFFPSIPVWHWLVMGGLSLVVGVVWGKRLSAFGAIALGVTVFLGLYLLDALALVRIGSHWIEHPGIDLRAEVQRIASGNEENLMLMLFNTAVFVPFGVALAGVLVSTGMGKWRCVGRVALVTFGLSLCIECIQLVFRVGVFELTDLLLNTVGAQIGGVALSVVFSIFC